MRPRDQRRRAVRRDVAWRSGRVVLGLAAWLGAVEAVAFAPPRSFPDTQTTTAVPEPPTLILAALGMAGLLLLRKPQYEQFIEEAVKSGLFRDRRHPLEEAVRLRRRAELLEHIEEGTRQLRRGEYHEVDEAGLRALFDDIEARGQARYTAGKGES